MRNKIFAIALATLIATAGFSLLKADANKTPSPAEIAAAEAASGSLIGTLAVGLFSLFDVTVPATVDQGNEAIRIIFDDGNPNIRLVGENGPLSDDNRPRDPLRLRR